MSGPTTLVGLDGNKVPFNHIGVIDPSSNKAPSVALVDQNGAPLNPATSDGLTSIVNTLGTPAQNGSITALGTSLASILTAMQDLDGKAATATNQASQSTVLSNILTALGPLATDADLQAATAKVEAVRAILAGTLAVSAASLPLPTGAATETTLTAIKNLMAAEASISESLWYDPTLSTPVYYFRQVINTDGVITYAWKNTDGTTASPNLSNIKPLGANSSLELLQTQYDVIAADTGTTIGNTLLRVIVMNLGVSPPVVAASLWINATTGAAISAPTPANIKEVTQDVTISQSVLPTGAATSALQTAGNASLASIDTKHPALVSGRIPVDNSGVTQPISSASLTSIDSKTPALVGGAVPVAFSSPQAVTISGAISAKVLPTMVYEANASGTGFSSGDVIIESFVLDDSTVPPTIGSAVFINYNTKAILSTAPTQSALTPQEQVIPSAIASSITATQTWQTGTLSAQNQLVTLLSEATQTGTLAANNAAVSITNGGNGTVGFKLSGTWVGTVSAYGTLDGAVYDQLLPIRSLNAAVSNFAPVTSLVSTGANVNGGYYVSGEGMSAVQLIMTPWTSGSATVAMVATGSSRGTHIRSSAADPAYVAGSIGGQALSATNGWPSAGVYNSAAPTLTSGTAGVLQLDASGNLKVTGSFGAVSASAPTYTAGTTQSLSLTTAGALRVDLSSSGVYGLPAAADPSLTAGTIAPLSTDLSGRLRVNTLSYGIGDSFTLAVATSSTNGVAIGTPPAGTRAVVVSLPPGSSITYAMKNAAPSSAPTGQITCPNTTPVTLRVREEIAGTEQMYVTAWAAGTGGLAPTVRYL